MRGRRERRRLVLQRCGQPAQVRPDVVGGPAERLDRRPVLGLAPRVVDGVLLGPVPRLGRGGRRRVPTALRPADGVPLGGRGGADPLGDLAEHGLGHLVAEQRVAAQPRPAAVAQLGQGDRLDDRRRAVRRRAGHRCPG
ncbi:hypothetical protein [Nocardioides sp. TF02-7]|uniref:hypothetical protein n=1 Tax=Nocardioides sp. TF02-7 TaxID=2917724 RepID=UPI001F065313|nr:hypothetical protein [Nocardioides sp. TF02-7]UMG94991.1 hypothetical protein MF408_00900 [Nocardioides sp. TF02-7]